MNDKVVFIDSIGRTVLGVENKKLSTKTKLAVDDPTLVFVQPNAETGQIQVQVIPLFFKELVDESARTGQLTWLFNRESLVSNKNLTLDSKLLNQYDRVVTAGPGEPPPGIVTAQPDASDPEEVKLFDEEDSE